MLYLEMLSHVMTIIIGLSTLTDKGAAYIKWRKEQAKNDPSASLAAPDGSDTDRMSNQ